MEVEADVDPGYFYFVGINGKPEDGVPTWAFRPGFYWCVGLARNYRTFQHLVVYASLNRWDAGLHLSGTGNWVRDFYRVDESEVPEACRRRASELGGSSTTSLTRSID